MIKVNYQLSEDEYTKAMRLYLNERFQARLRLAVFAMVAFVTLALVATGAFDDTFFVSVAVVLAVLFGVVFQRYRALPGKLYRSDSIFNQPISATFAEEGATFITPETRTEVRWSHYKQVWETDAFFFLYSSKTRFNLIPKRAFDGQSLYALRELLRQKVSRTFEREFQGAGIQGSPEATYTPRRLAPPDWR
jgi:hypothetical protein